MESSTYDCTLVLKIFQVLDLGLGLFSLHNRLESGNPSKHKSSRSCSQEVSAPVILRGQLLWWVVKSSDRRVDPAHGMSTDFSSLGQGLLFLRVQLVLFRLRNILHSVTVPGASSLWVQQLA